MRWTSEQAQRRGAVAHQQVFGLLIGIQRHLVRFPADAGLFIAAERRAEADKTNLHSKSTFEPLCSRRSIAGLWRKVLTFTGMAATKNPPI